MIFGANFLITQTFRHPPTFPDIYPADIGGLADSPHFPHLAEMNSTASGMLSPRVLIPVRR